MLLDAVYAVYYFYILFFTATLFVLFVGIKMLYQAAASKNDDMLRKAKFVLLFAIIAMLCVLAVSFFVTGKLPVN